MVRSSYIHVRASEDTVEKLKYLADINSMSQADVLENLINNLYKEGCNDGQKTE